MSKFKTWGTTDFSSFFVLTLVGGLEHGFYFPFSWECRNPSWRTPSFFRRVGEKPPTSNQLVSSIYFVVDFFIHTHWIIGLVQKQKIMANFYHQIMNFYHPAVITIKKWYVYLPFPGKWVVKMAVFFPHRGFREKSKSLEPIQSDVMRQFLRFEEDRLVAHRQARRHDGSLSRRNSCPWISRKAGSLVIERGEIHHGGVRSTAISGS